MTRKVLSCSALWLCWTSISAAQWSCPDSLYGVWQLSFAVGRLVHEATLKMDGCLGTMRVRYLNRETHLAEEISEPMRLSQTARGLQITGSSPVLVRTNRPATMYAADVLLYGILPSDVTSFQNCDGVNPCSPVKIESERLATRLWLRNRCSQSISVAVVYRTSDDRWVRRGWFVVPPLETAETNVATLNPFVYFYGEGAGQIWRGRESTSLTRTVTTESFDQPDSSHPSGKPVSFFRSTVNLTRSSFVQEFTCP